EGAELFLEEARSHNGSQGNDANVHGREHQGGILRENLVSADVEENIPEIQQAQYQTGQQAASVPDRTLGQKPAQHQHSCQGEGHDQTAGEGRPGFGELFEHDVDHAIAQPDSQQHQGRMSGARVLLTGLVGTYQQAQQGGQGQAYAQ